MSNSIDHKVGKMAGKTTTITPTNPQHTKTTGCASWLEAREMRRDTGGCGIWYSVVDDAPRINGCGMPLRWCPYCGATIESK
jgi:hypothetical protein